MKRIVLLLLASVACVSCTTTTDPKMMSYSDVAYVGKVDSDMQDVLDAHASLRPKPLETLSVEDARRQPTMTDGVIQLMQAKGNPAPDKLPPVGKVEMKSIPTSGGQSIPVRVYTPQGNGPFPVIVYFHGGGWVIATLDTYDASCRALCAQASAVVVSVDYRQAPENKFPAAHEDCYVATQYVLDHASDFGGSGRHVAVAGESAGGNLATGVCLMALERGGKLPVHQALVYPITNYAFNTASYQQNASAKPLNAAMMQWFFKHYLNGPADGEKLIVSPLRASDAQLRRLPPATIVTAEIDPLRSEGIAYAEKLRKAGVDTALQNYQGVTHEFFGASAVIGKAKTAQAFVVGRLKAAFDSAPAATRPATAPTTSRSK